MSTMEYAKVSFPPNLTRYDALPQRDHVEQLPENLLLQFAQELRGREIPQCFNVAASDFGPTMRSYITHIAQIVPVGELEIPAAFRLSKEGDITTVAANMYDRPHPDETVSRHVVLQSSQESRECAVTDERSAAFPQQGVLLRSAHTISFGAFLIRTHYQEMVINNPGLKRVIKESTFPYDSHTPGRHIMIEHYPKGISPYVKYATPDEVKMYNSIMSHLGFTDPSLEALVR